jgi:virulence factor Mce-like protein
MAPHEHHASHTYFDNKPHLTVAGKTAATACFVVACFAGILATTHLIGTPLPFLREYTVSVVVPNAQDVIPDSQVTMGGATAGRVDEVSLTPQGARITMRLFDRWQHIHRDATASIRVKSLLGERFVNIDPGSPSQPELPSGSTLAGRGTLSVELTDVLNMLDPHTRSDLGVLISSMANGTAGRGADVNTAIRDLRTLVTDLEPATGAVAKRAADVQHLVGAADSVTRDLAAQQGDLARLVERANSSVRSLNNDRAPLLTVIDQGDRLSTAFSDILNPPTQAGIRDTLNAAPPALGQAALLGSTLTPTVAQVRPVTSSITQLIPEIRSTWSFADANGHWLRVFALGGGPNNLATTSNGDRRPAANTTVGQEGDQAPGFFGLPGLPGAPASGPASGGAAHPAVVPDTPLWTLLFGEM